MLYGKFVLAKNWVINCQSCHCFPPFILKIKSRLELEERKGGLHPLLVVKKLSMVVTPNITLGLYCIM